MLLWAHFLVVMATFFAASSTCIQIMACARPFRQWTERAFALVACITFMGVSANTLWHLLDGGFAATPVTFFNWLAALMLVTVLWATLGRFEKYMDGMPKKSAIWRAGVSR